MSSTRLPNKVLLPILGKPMLQHEIERALRAKKIGKLILATSTAPEDSAIADLAKKTGVGCFRGSLDDVLARYYLAAAPHKPTTVVRITGDCPLLDPEIFDQVIAFFESKNVDYASNSLTQTFPDGLDVEVFKFSALEAAYHEAKLKSEREHVTLFINRHPERFSVANYESPVNYSHLRWTVDEPRDFEFVTKVYEKLYPKNPYFGMKEILELIQKEPELQALNSKIIRNEGLIKSLEKDKT